MAYGNLHTIYTRSPPLLHICALLCCLSGTTVTDDLHLYILRAGHRRSGRQRTPRDTAWGVMAWHFLAGAYGHGQRPCARRAVPRAVCSFTEAARHQQDMIAAREVAILRQSKSKRGRVMRRSSLIVAALAAARLLAVGFPLQSAHSGRASHDAWRVGLSSICNTPGLRRLSGTTDQRCVRLRFTV